ncbi:MAG TPA: UDP-glucose/GDP-mannose dehydrogenase family protein, partial [Thermoplasmatales archaeon]|nr:UDP-glucose/GDP-mannose dehydrogenase family protein [Thermoplasmatales archaeon]
MHIGVIGAGYVGLVTGACLADTGNKVTLVDVDREKVDSINRGVPPIHEEGLEELLRRNQHRITASTSYHDLDEAQIFFICVGTPSAPDGSINLRYVEEAAGTIAGRLGDNWKLIVVKSTVIPGTTEE